MEANGLRERVGQSERRLDQAEQARAKIWDKVNNQEVDLTKLAGTMQRFDDRLKRVDEKLDEAKRERAVDRKKLDESKDEQGDRRFQVVLIVLGVTAGPVIFAVASLIAHGGHP